MTSSKISGLLSKYSAMTAGIIIANDVQSQVVYTDIDPDEQLSAWMDDFYYADIDADGVVDFTIHQNLWTDMYCDSSWSGVSCDGWTYQSLDVYGAGVDFVNDLASSIGIYGVPSATPLPAGAVISIGANWNGSGFTRLFSNGGDWYWYYDDVWGEGGWVNFDYENGQWQDIEAHKYLGIKFLIDGAVHYGWIEMTADRGDEIQQIIKIYGFAYEATPGAPIVAGYIPSCDHPLPLDPVAITGTTAKVKWSALDSVDHFELQYRPVGALTWITKNVAGAKSFRKVAGLTCDTGYEWRIRSFCLDGEVSEYSDLQNFTTASCRLSDDFPEIEIPITVYAYANELHILLDDDEPANWQCKVFDMLGHSVLEPSLYADDNIIQTNLPSGIYIITMEYNGQIFSQKVSLYQ